MSDSPAALLYDAAGNALAVKEDVTIPANTSGLLAMGSDDDGKAQRLRIQADRSLVVTSGAAPGDPSLLLTDFVRQAGAVPDTSDLRVDGGTPVDFDFNADPTKDVFILSVSFVMVAPTIAFGGNRFANLSTLANGVQILIDTGTPIEYYNIRVNEDYIHFASPGGYGYDVAAADIIRSQYLINGAIRLGAASSHKVTVRVRDDLSSGLNYFKCLVKAFKEA